MDNFDSLFVAFSGPSGLGRAIGKSTQHAGAMKHRKSIPVRYWPRLIEAARERGILLDEAMLVALHTEQVAA